MGLVIAPTGISIAKFHVVQTASLQTKAAMVESGPLHHGEERPQMVCGAYAATMGTPFCPIAIE